ncbi:MAG: YdiU family protein [Phenylobacterium sp.]|uniref:protein adenylyltransferase SelO n=1 Tax=Phenylobacterium sp. TaxID=1871053 RepID=UPI001B7337C2|nr:YdiU family protein [Phenylobacterium sp.]MBP7649559.1 YdiU family protein [Phenylobacterium sp.]MBP7815360.1 YdiU family protein [Phenylobacterium sp.]MBP9230629.1 YdiU family protein [Phenylobacterium sp.]MBP9753720.1 YdiU family protein [Phenylobacterium sp.]
MPVSSAYRPDPRLPDLGPEFADPVAAADFPQVLLRFRNDRAAATVGLDTLTDPEWVAHFGRFQPLPGNLETPLAQRYHGHQFRVYNPDLGDGRGFTFAQLREVGSDRLLDLGTKGSGTTPWSRAGDGRLTLKGGMREVLATAMLEALGVPTSKAFSLIETGEALERGDEPSPTRSAVLTRLSHGHIRFGTFQRQAFLEQPHEIVRLVDYVIETYYPELDKAPDRTSALLTAVVERAGTLAASWMAAGFVHGVLNTDNMNITGESFDYGPYRFLPHNDPNFVAAYFDQQGLYSFGRQPEAVFWNLQNLGGCLSMVAEQQPLVDALNGFADAYRGGLAAAMLRRLGLKSRGRELDAGLVNAAFTALAAGGERLRWEPFFFDWFCGDVGRAMASPRGDIYGGQPFADFRRRVAETEPDRPGRLLDPYFARAEPEELLIDEIEAIWEAIAAEDDWTAFHAKLARIETARKAWDL